MSFISIILVIFCGYIICENVNISRITGHLRRFGVHMDPMGVTAIGRFSSPGVFYGHFVKTNRPILMQSALSDAGHPGLDIWSDDFLRYI